MKMKLTVEHAEEIARDLYGWGQVAVYDMACDELGADEVWDDREALQDIFADRIHDRTCMIEKAWDSPEYHRAFILICDKLAEIGHTALKEAMDGAKAWHVRALEGGSKHARR